jgi:Family of unknown function (DUF5681)
MRFVSHHRDAYFSFGGLAAADRVCAMTDEAGEKPDNAGKKQDGRFKKGQSGNPCGMRRGSRHRATLAAEKLLDGEAQELSP